MAYLDEKLQQQVSQFLQDLKDPVQLLIYPGPQSEYFQVFWDISQEVAQLTPLFSVATLDKAPELEPGHETGQSITGPIGILADKQHQETGIRYVGIPSGLEFGTFLEDIKALSTHHVTLSEKTQETLKQLGQPVHIQVFTTPTCRWCPRAVRLAHDMSLIQPHITADLIDSGTFNELAARYDVSSVPKSIFNGHVEILGAVPENEYLKGILNAALH
ncbi:MAG: hypothetical protein C7B47_11100 [Sulfobacillus thermosulfidooxidans]|uniref:Thioredoxin-like fold domain-containing protein n=1 Tax=Sulfobacillus thermosulfidooxidans TaxID=28034 RepID=A0A2T2WU41_SULTH|nr:MAG: hypothetical protein C7B47_11100 [Sulfobacillus thermosulfidooxidans]